MLVAGVVVVASAVVVDDWLSSVGASVEVAATDELVDGSDAPLAASVPVEEHDAASRPAIRSGARERRTPSA